MERRCCLVAVGRAAAVAFEPPGAAGVAASGAAGFSSTVLTQLLHALLARNGDRRPPGAKVTLPGTFSGVPPRLMQEPGGPSSAAAAVLGPRVRCNLPMPAGRG